MRSDTFNMMRLWSRVRSGWKGVGTPRPPATPVSGLRAGVGAMIDFAADGGAMSWHSSAGEAEAFYPVDPYLIELGWRAWDCMGEENILGHMGFPDHLVSFLGGGLGA
jgi:hypothetical protein